MTEHEMDPLARLRASDPFATATYEHADVPAMMARITARQRVQRVSFARGFRVRMAGAAAAAALLSAGGIAALETSSVTPSILAIGAAPSATHLGNNAHVPSSTADGQNATTKIPAEPLMPLDVTFAAGADLSTQTESAPSYTLTPAGDFGALSATIAAAFSVSGSPSTTPGPNSYWTVGDTSGDFLSFWSDAAEINWQYTNSSEAGKVVADRSPPSSTTTSPTSQADAVTADNADLSAAESTLGQIGIVGPFGTPEFSQSDGGDGISWTTVTLPWTVGGPGAGFEFDMTYDPSGALISASGVDVAVATGTDYPLISPVAGVATLNAERASVWSGSGGSGGSVQSGTTVNPGGPNDPAPSASGDTTTTTSPPTGGGSTGDGSSSTTTTTTPPPPVVTLTSATLEYSVYVLTDGSEVLLPEWSYTGDDGSTWSVLAVDPSYVTISTSGGNGLPTPQMY